MGSRGWLAISIGFGAQLLLIALLGFGAMRRASELHEATVGAHSAYLEADAVLREIPEDLHLGGILIRDYLLDPDSQMAGDYREQLRAQRASIQAKLRVLEQKLGKTEPAKLKELQREIQGYWASMDPILMWTFEERLLQSRSFLRNSVIPKREAVIALAREIGEINAENLRREQERLARSHEAFQGFLKGMSLAALCLGLVVAGVSAGRVVQLERRGELQRRRAETAEREMRQLSRKVVHAQEEERRSLSRELHDAVGQMLSAMTMELGNLEASAGSPERLRERLGEARKLNADTIREVREMAMGLRPSMLDELGLAPALRWQGREFSRRSGVPVTVQVDGELDGLPETHRTCVYRVVQEGLTNCARHAQAQSIRISAYGGVSLVRLTIQDDGTGFEVTSGASRGLGLIGIEERVRELDGSLKIGSQPGRGTILEVELPLREEAAAG